MEEVAVRTASDLAQGTLKVKREKSFANKMTESALKFGFVKDLIFNKAKGQIYKSTNGLYPAPLKVGMMMINLLFQELTVSWFDSVDFRRS